MKVQLPSGIEMFYEETGSGVPLVLIPGTGCDHQIWGLQLEEWSKHFRVIAIDNRGSGQSSIPDEFDSYYVEVMADDVAFMIDALQLGPCHLSGHSVGASIAQQVAVRHHDKVKSLQLHATFGRADAWFKSAFIATMRYPILHGDPHFCLKTCLMWAMSPSYLETKEPQSAKNMVTRCLVKNPHMNSQAGLLGHLNADEHYDALHQLGDIRVPTLITAGEVDLLVPKRYSEEVCRHMNASLYHEFKGPNASHFALWEIPDEFSKVTTEFLLSL